MILDVEKGILQAWNYISLQILKPYSNFLKLKDPKDTTWTSPNLPFFKLNFNKACKGDKKRLHIICMC
jgi:hypothetical protein